ncbi:MAG TPA: TlpA disulfide reductase family protein [Chitinophagaceae bacterium]|nr:TlpA disulfide reductase family protein [Chitinophagaceae bacterium]
MKNILSAYLLLIGQFCTAQPGNYTVTGKIKGLVSEKMYITVRDESAKSGFRRDSIPVIKESFTYTAPIGGIIMILISPGVEAVMKRVGNGFFPAKSSLLQFFAFPGANIKFSGKITDFVDAYPSGDKINNAFASLSKSINPLLNKSVNLSLKIANKVVTDSAAVKSINDSIKILDDKVVTMKVKFVSENTASVAAIWVLSDMMLRSQVSNETAVDLFKKMNREKLVTVPFYSEVAKRVDAISSTSVGQKVPDISSSNTYDGKRFELVSLKGKYVIIDFWGTWCIPCISGMPKMKEYLNKYKSKLKIVGVAQESDNGERWKKFLTDKSEYHWYHVLSRNNEDYILKFGVAGFPTKILVDPDGIIIGRFVGEDDAIYIKLDEILK